MKKLAIALGITGLVLAGAGAALYVALLPPRIPVPEAQGHVFHDVTLLEPGRPPLPGQTLRIADGRIASIRPTLPGEAAEATGAAAALTGLVVTPGLIDLHVHYPPQVAIGNPELWSLLFLAHGVTTVRETGSIDGSIFRVRAAIEAGRTPGPRIFACGLMIDGTPPSFPSNRVVTTPAEVRAAVREQAEAGADCIKAYNMLEPAVLTALVEEAGAQGLPAIGHVPHAASFETAGLVDLQHGTGAVLIDREKIGRMDFRWEDWETVDEGRVAYVAAVSRGQGIAHTPTLVNGRMRKLLLDPAAGEAAWQRDTGLRHLPRFWIGVWETLWGNPYDPADPAATAAHAGFMERQPALAAGLHAAGAQIHAGTDTLMPYVAPGSSLHGELADLRAAGIPAQDVWRIATQDAGEALGAPGLGTLAIGAPADLVFLKGVPPPEGIAWDPSQTAAVVAAGRVYLRGDLDETLSRLDDHFNGRSYRAVMSVLVRSIQGTFAP